MPLSHLLRLCVRFVSDMPQCKWTRRAEAILRLVLIKSYCVSKTYSDLFMHLHKHPEHFRIYAWHAHFWLILIVQHWSWRYFGSKICCTQCPPKMRFSQQRLHLFPKRLFKNIIINDFNFTSNLLWDQFHVILA